MTSIHPKEIFACALGMCIGALLATLVVSTTPNLHDELTLLSSHPIADPYDTKYHVHADFTIVIKDEEVDLSADQYMTTGSQHLHSGAHLHDNNGDVKHIHAEDVTFAAFLSSLGLELTDTCIALADESEFCSTDEEQLLLFVNNEPYTEPIPQYVPVDNDRILVYFGNPESEEISQYLESVTDDSCYYSGTCPERGIAPSEECGLTCDL